MKNMLLQTPNAFLNSLQDWSTTSILWSLRRAVKQKELLLLMLCSHSHSIFSPVATAVLQDKGRSFNTTVLRSAVMTSPSCCARSTLLCRPPIPGQEKIQPTNLVGPWSAHLKWRKILLQTSYSILYKTGIQNQHFGAYKGGDAESLPTSLMVFSHNIFSPVATAVLQDKGRSFNTTVLCSAVMTSPC